MKNILSFLIIVIILFSSCTKVLQREQINDLLTAYKEIDKFNGVVLVAKNNEIIYQKGYGFADYENNIKTDINHIYSVFSITKTMTSTLIFKLIETGKLKLDTKLSLFYPDFPNADSITIEHLLTHTSGIFNHTTADELSNYSEENLLGFLSSKPLNFSPGTDWEYCNSGYTILGFIIAKVTKMPYENAIRKYIFKPANMTNSGFDFKYSKDKNKVIGYESLTLNTQKIATVPDSTWVAAAGSVYSTAGDLFRFHQAMQQYKIINEKATNLAYRVSAVNENYGHGWQLEKQFGKQTIGHSGGGDGFRTMFKRIVEDDVCVILLCNIENVNLEAVSNQLLRIAYVKPYQLPENKFELSNEELKKYVGTFQSNEEQNIYINREEAQLFIQYSNNRKSELWTQEKNYFYIEEKDAHIRFLESSSGQIDSLIYFENGKKLITKRINATWGITGTATPNGWEGQDLLLQPLGENIWIIENVILRNGSFKFRFNNDWLINYGSAAQSDFLIPFGDNIPIGNGKYDITLDLSNENKPNYTIEKL